jgi:hypothetical protein
VAQLKIKLNKRLQLPKKFPLQYSRFSKVLVEQDNGRSIKRNTEEQSEAEHDKDASYTEAVVACPGMGRAADA